MNSTYNIYIHVPFCMSKCNYCAFFSQACAKPDWETYTKNIKQELLYWSKVLGRINVSTVFFGGGTPSLMPTASFSEIIVDIYKLFEPTGNCEISFEANPGTIDKKKLDSFIAAGANRISIGIQSLDDDKLKFLGRRHDTKTALKILETALKKNIRVSADFIYGLPGEDTKYITQLCKDINRLGLTHCSLYELTIEPNTPFGRQNLQMPSNEEMADMYLAISETLGLPRYEVSNYAVDGQECRHNLNVWDGAPYIGIGKGAAGRVLIDNQWYEQMGGGEKFEKISDETRAEERLITGLRQTRGVYLDNNVKKIINMDYVQKYQDLLQQTSDNRIAATKNGILILDDLILNLMR